MRYILFLVFCTVSVCLAQKTYYDDEYSFSIDIPSDWCVSFEDEWPAELTDAINKRYISKTLFILNPIDSKALANHCIRVSASPDNANYSFISAHIKKNGKRLSTRSMKRMADELVGESISQYRKKDTFYDYAPSSNLNIGKTLYKHGNDNKYLIVACATYIERSQSITFRGWSCPRKLVHV